MKLEKLDDILVVDRNRSDRIGLEEPQKIGEYIYRSVGDNNLKYLHIPSPVSLDLLDGYDEDMTYHSSGANSNSKINPMLRWLSTDKNLDDRLEDTDFFTSRSLLSYIMAFPYERDQALSVCATKMRGNIYLGPHYGYNQSSDQIHNIQYFNKCSFSIQRFKQYVTSSDPDRPPDPNFFNPDFKSYSAVVSTRIQDKFTNRFVHSLVYTSPVDCIDGHKDLDPESLANTVELRVINELPKGRQIQANKTLKWWTQAFLGGVSSIYCGHRDYEFMVRRVERLDVNGLPVDAFWSTNVCLNFLNNFLNHVKEVVTTDDPNVVYVFSMQPRKRHITCTRTEPGDEFQVIPEWFLYKFPYH